MTLISIFSNNNIFELIPIIYEFKEKIKTHYIICDEVDKKEAKRFKKAIKNLLVRYNLKFKNRLIALDEDSKSEFEALTKDIKSKNLYLNATNADTSLIVLFSYFVLKNKGLIIAYDKFENSYNLISKKHFSNHHIKHNMKLYDFFTLLDYKIEKNQSLKEILKKKEPLKTLFKDFEALFYIRKNYNNLSSISSLYQPQLEALQELEFIDKSLKPIKPTNLFGFLFEEFIALELIRYNFDDIKVGVQLIFDKKNDITLRNEFDMIAIKDNHIYTFECKFGSQKNLDPQDIVYKSDSLLANFGEDSKALIINIHPNYNNDYNFNKSSKLRANYNNIYIYNAFTFNKERFQNILLEFFKIKQRVFLLGGQDLEMKTIKALLTQYNQKFYDKKLSWDRAKLSEYKSFFNNKECFYAIELLVDTTPPLCFKLIDHHNQFQHKKSALEQVADILNLNLTRYGKLVALNDTGYIKAMQKYGATQKEIEKIRKRDRAAQGVTKEDEELAKKAIKNAKEIDDIIVIKSQTNKFSPIVDRLYGKNLLIYSDTTLSYYGRDIKKLVEHFNKEIQEQKAYYGGNYGYFGISQSQDIKKEKEKILKILGVNK